jgi:hypothetical protein
VSSIPKPIRIESAFDAPPQVVAWHGMDTPTAIVDGVRGQPI